MLQLPVAIHLSRGVLIREFIVPLVLKPASGCSCRDLRSCWLALRPATGCSCRDLRSCWLALRPATGCSCRDLRSCWLGIIYGIIAATISEVCCCCFWVTAGLETVMFSPAVFTSFGTRFASGMVL